jgi:hypothetical protein
VKWTLLILVLGTHPVGTNMVFDSLAQCLQAEYAMRSEQARAFNEWWTSADAEARQKHRDLMERRSGIKNWAACVPTK